ncbi:glycosyltransferase involved in cell wall biosynthesis [Chryseobacterium ginsenosidimutans]|uniref:glycosyltransferase family 4 protein n=1 Tax=Chryseobacterium ginsenosidimutans TaxID=687846 RepID=UPI002789ABB5|nr:glycosyltransferase family 1 protein [Chryseobacterium ginsenosidimutans]MDQ0593044.1 glycosyltransferase involved in cell wall biosynthesis [Chryseobacterium ginsenosidimutans]
MEIHFFERNPAEGQISIEKLFSVIKKQLNRKSFTYKTFINPFTLSKFFKTLVYFKKNQGEINHITGDIHWVSLVLDSKKTVLTVHDLSGLYQYKGIKKWLYYLLWIYFPLKKLKYITVISEKTKLEILKLLPSVADKIQVIPNCITIDILPFDLKRYNTTPKILIVGTRSNKNIERVLQASKNLNIELTIVGKLETTQVEILKKNNHHYTNYVNISEDSLKMLYDENDILCFPSLYEGFGLPILEAQARNCVVITSDISPMNDVAGIGALFVDPYNTEEIRNSIIKIISNDDIKKELILKGHKNVKKYSPEIVVKQYIALYQKILAAK